MVGADAAAIGCRVEVNRRLRRRNGCSMIRHDAVANTTATAILTGNQIMLSSSCPAAPTSAVTAVSAGRCRR